MQTHPHDLSPLLWFRFQPRLQSAPLAVSPSETHPEAAEGRSIRLRPDRVPSQVDCTGTHEIHPGAVCAGMGRLVTREVDAGVTVKFMR